MRDSQEKNPYFSTKIVDNSLQKEQITTQIANKFVRLKNDQSSYFFL